MNKYILQTVFLLIFPFSLKSQQINNNLNIFYSYAMNKMCGNHYSTNDVFSIPSFYSNFKESKSMDIGFNYRLNEKVRIGGKLKNTTFLNWKISNNDLYNDSHILQNKLCLISQYSILRLKRNFRMVIEVNPYLGNAKTRLSNNVTGFIHHKNQTEIPCSNNFIGGFESSIGIDISIAQSFGIITNVGLNKGWTKSALFYDKSYFYTFSTFGFYLKFLKDKRFKYE